MLAVALASVALAVAGCGGSSSSSSFSQCMRKHGVTGAFASPLGKSMPTSLPTSGPNGRRRGVQIPAKASAAMQACHSLAPRPGQGSGPA